MLKALPLILSLSLTAIACEHSKDYVHTTETLTEAGQTVNLASQEAVRACKSSRTVIGKAQAHEHSAL